jgi:hypothetical protein
MAAAGVAPSHWRDRPAWLEVTPMTIHVPAHHPTTHLAAERALLATLIVAAAVVLAALALLIVPQLAPSGSTSPMVVGDDGWRLFRAEEQRLSTPASVVGDATWRQFRAEEQTVQDPYRLYILWRAEERGS